MIHLYALFLGQRFVYGTLELFFHFLLLLCRFHLRTSTTKTMSDKSETKPTETKPTVPALDLESAGSGSSFGAMDRKRSLSGKLKGKIKKMLTPRSTNSSNSNLAAKDTESVSEVSESIADAVEAPSVTEDKVPSRFSQQKEEPVDEVIEKKEEGEKEPCKHSKGLIGGAAVGVALVLGIILAGSSKCKSKDKPVEEEKEKKKGIFARK